jgi:3-deoxy-D-arabino-heptulosonate 7-phosphate (DAHP) synthase
VQEANLRAQDILKQVDEELSKMRLETDQFIDAKLANFEESLQKTIQVVRRGREKISSSYPQDLR